MTILRALAGVGRRELLTEQGVEQGGLARLDLPGDRQPQRSAELRRRSSVSCSAASGIWSVARASSVSTDRASGSAGAVDAA